MVATDSYRLSVKETAARRARSTARSRRTCRPGRCRSSAGSPAPARPRRSAWPRSRTRSCSRVDDVVLSSRLVEGRFPNYQQLLPESYEHELRVSREELLEVVRRVGLLAQKNAPLRLRFSEGALDVSAQTPDVGEASESLPVPFEGEPLEIGFNPEFFRDGLESAESEELSPQADQPAAAGPDRVRRRRRRLRLPRHADPPERLGRAVRVTRLELRDFRNYERGRGRAAAGPDRGRRPERRRQDEPARGALLRLHRRARRARRTSASWCAAARRWRGWSSTRSATRATRTGSRWASSPARPKRAAASTARASRAWRPSTARPLVSVFLPERLELVKGAPAARRAHLDQLVAALWPARAETRAAYSRALAQRNALLGAHPGRRRRARRRSTPGTPSWRATGVRLMADRARGGRRRCAPPFAELAGQLGLPGRGGAALPPALRGRRRRGPRGRAGRAPRRRPRARLHRPRPAPRRAAAAARRARRCAPTARRASSARRCWRCCSPSASCSPTAAAARR